MISSSCIPSNGHLETKKDVYKVVEAMAQTIGAVNVRWNDYLLDCFESDLTINVSRLCSESESVISMITIDI